MNSITFTHSKTHNHMFHAHCIHECAEFIVFIGKQNEKSQTEKLIEPIFLETELKSSKLKWMNVKMTNQNE